MRCVDNDIALVFLPTYLSWLNRIECEFAALRYFALYGTAIAATTSGTRRSRAASAGLTSTPDPFATPPSAPRSGARITCLTRPNDRPGRRAFGRDDVMGADYADPESESEPSPTSAHSSSCSGIPPLTAIAPATASPRRISREPAPAMTGVPAT